MFDAKGTGLDVGYDAPAMARPAGRILTALAFAAFISLGLPDGVLGVAWPSVQESFHLPVSHMGLLLAATSTPLAVVAPR